MGRMPLITITLRTWHVLSKAGQSDLGSRRQLPGVFCARDVRSPHSRDGHLRVTYVAWPIPCLFSC